MIKEDNGSYYLEFFNQNLVLVLISAFVMAPVIPGHIAQWILGLATLISGSFSLVFFALRRSLLKLSTPAERSSSVVALTSDEAFAMFKVICSTTLMMVLVLAWMGFAKMLWVFESFFVLVVAFHILNMMACVLIEMSYIKQEVDEIKAALTLNDTDLPE